jgi:serine/threonine protein kinase
MATVYLAQDLRHDRLVALKVLRSELAATLGPERFLREIRLAARLQHPTFCRFTTPAKRGAALVRHARRRRRIGPELQPYVKEAREGLARLTAEQN